jgi:multidrug resistance efflux pump
MNQTVPPSATENATPVAAPKLIKASAPTVAAALVVALAGATAILWAWHLGPFDSPIEATDNAYVRGQVTVLSPQVSGYVKEVLVRDFEHVKAGQPLIRIDDRIYTEQLAQAEAQRDLAAANLANAEQTMAQGVATVDVRKAAFDQANAQLAQVEANFKRVSSLTDKGFKAETDLDGATSSLKVAEAAVDAAKANVTLAEVQVKAAEVSRTGLAAQLRAAEAAVDLARINLGNTVVSAPQDGQISENSARTGQYVTTGSQLMFLVPNARWVVANFKETQTAHMTIGQHVSIAVDGLGGAMLDGTVEEMAPATGSEFSVLKADNASGNFTKVVQRIPVRIHIRDGQPAIDRLRPGMSVTARVDTSPAAS